MLKQQISHTDWCQNVQNLLCCQLIICLCCKICIYVDHLMYKQSLSVKMLINQRACSHAINQTVICRAWKSTKGKRARRIRRGNSNSRVREVRRCCITEIEARTKGMRKQKTNEPDKKKRPNRFQRQLWFCCIKASLWLSSTEEEKEMIRMRKKDVSGNKSYLANSILILKKNIF